MKPGKTIYDSTIDRTYRTRLIYRYDDHYNRDAHIIWLSFPGLDQMEYYSNSEGNMFGEFVIIGREHCEKHNIKF